MSKASKRMRQIVLASPLALSLGALTGIYTGQAAAEMDCSSVPEWNSETIYTTEQVQFNNSVFRSKWWNRGQQPDRLNQWGVWLFIDDCMDTNTPPAVEFSSPSNGDEIPLNVPVNLLVFAVDLEDQILDIQFTANGASISSPWTPTQAGPVNLSVTATDSQGASDTDSITVTVSNLNNQNPETSIQTPSSGTSVREGDNLLVTASASDPDVDDSIERVVLLVDSQEVASDNSAPYEFTWPASIVGSHSLTTRAYDQWGASGDSTAITVTVIEGNKLPEITLTSPGDNTQVDPGTMLMLSANASDPDGSISQVSFMVNGSVIHTDTSSPYSFNWMASGDGDTMISAMAYDNEGAMKASNPASIYVGTPIADHEQCRPEGLVGDSVYCDIYDSEGREKMGSDHGRRIIGYFTSWRNGANGMPTYLVNDIPWDKLTHINYAFAHIGPDKKISVGNVNNPDNPATGMTWPGVIGAEMDPSLSYQGHFNLLTKFKKQYPDVKTLISVGGWAETGGYFDEDGTRVADGGFYTLAQSETDINTFADSVVDFLRTYGFDGADIDYEYATSMDFAGNPDDFQFSNARRPQLYQEYDTLMRILREKLDEASKEDGKHYMLTVAAPSSGWLLRGQETYGVARFLDYVNVMTYDLHGAWNEHVGHNAALYDTGEDSELAFWNVYGTPQFGGIGYLNTDWAFHYFRGSLPAGRINLGIPYYTRGWQDVQGGTNGLWGSSAWPDQESCPPGTGMGKNVCGWGAEGIDNLWHDKDAEGNEIVSGVNPMWHAKNLEEGIAGSYREAFGLTPDSDEADTLTGEYVRYYDDVAEASWLWNEEKKVYLATEDLQAMNAKTEYINNKGVGGIMFWELAGDFSWNAVRGEYYMGYDMTTAAYEAFRHAAPYGNKKAERDMPMQVLDIKAEFSGFRPGDQNYPIEVKLKLTNDSNMDLPEGTEISFDISTATSNLVISTDPGSGVGVVEDGSNAGGGNVGGLENTFHRVAFQIPKWVTVAAGTEWSTDMQWYVPVSTPGNWIAKVGGVEYGFTFENPGAEKYCEENPEDEICIEPPPPTCASQSIDISGYTTYPDFKNKDWAGNPSHAVGGDKMANGAGEVYVAKWWTNKEPGTTADWDFLCNLGE